MQFEFKIRQSIKVLSIRNVGIDSIETREMVTAIMYVDGVENICGRFDVW